MEPPFDELDGVIDTTSGYTGGTVANPTYEQVTAGNTGHYEAVRVTYDTDVIEYSRLLEVFWRNVDPLDAGGQFCDRGEQYRSAIFYSDPQQKEQAEASKQALTSSHSFSGEEIVTPILEASAFYEAEAYHQNYYEKNPLRYRFYRLTCGRDGRLEEVWSNQGRIHGSLPGVVGMQLAKKLIDGHQEIPMPDEWTARDERQYEHVRQHALSRGRTSKRAKEIASRVVNKRRRQEGRTRNKTTMGYW